MKIVGFSFIRNAVLYDFPIVEAITSILPICDEFVLAVGQGQDDTLALIQQIDSPKIKIIHTVWDESLTEGGQVLASETNKAFAEVSTDADWAFYIQGDEVIHENDLDIIKKAMHQHKDNRNVDGLLLHYKHFYGSYDYIGDSPKWYRREIRIVRPSKNIYSYRDAQGFRKDDDKKLNVKQIEAPMYHYGWVKDPRTMKKKHDHIHQYWSTDVEDELHKKVNNEAFDYSIIDSLAKFDGTHPAVMKERIARQNWQFAHDISYKNLRLKYRFKMWVEKLTGWQIFEYKNYKLI